MNRFRWAVAALMLAGAVQAEDKPLTYPKTKKVDVVDTYHGQKVEDPFRWLEDDVRKNPDVAAWVAEQNKVTDAYLATIPERDAIKKRITDLFNYEKISAPSKIGGRIFYSKNDGLQNQSVLFVQDSAEGEPRELINPNTLTKDGTVALAGTAISEDAKYIAYGLAEAGSDWNTWKVRDIGTGKDLSDELKWVKFSGASWTHDGRGFFYSRFPEPKGEAKFQATNENQQLYYHRLGTPQSDDVLVYAVPDHPKWTVAGGVSEDGRYLLIELGDGTTSGKSRVLVKDLMEPLAMPTTIIPQADARLDVIGNDGPLFYMKTDDAAPKGRVVVIDIRKPEKANWKTLIPEGKDVLNGVGFIGGLFSCNYLQDAKTVVKFFNVDGKFVRDVQFPDAVGTAGGFGGKRTETETYYSFTSFNRPPTIFAYDVITGTSKLFRQPKVKFDPNDYEVKQVFYPSKDGTKIPLFITHKKGIKLDGTNPTLLYGYGGFNISLTPSFSVSRLQWMEMGGVYAMACLRGGGEYGEDWHRAGTKLKKQNVFDDFIGAAEYLVKEKYTAPKKIGIQGGSNGGLLVGACLAQRPDLFGSALPAVGVMDMLRFQNFTAGRYWVDDYGSSDNKEEFEALIKYSPYHVLKTGVEYPPTLVTTADTDDRVVPGHSFKFTAKIQDCQKGPNPVLARIETKAGHGAGKPTAKVIEEAADQWAFLVKTLNFKPTVPK
jgi:prolyl oligopeptidase